MLDQTRADSHKILSLEERLNSLLNAQYGKRSERFNPDQLSLLNEAEVIAASEADQANEQDNVSHVAAHQRRGTNQRKPIPDYLPRVDITHELDEHERQYTPVFVNIVAR